MKIKTGILIVAALALSVGVVALLAAQYREKDFVDRVRKAGL